MYTTSLGKLPSGVLVMLLVTSTTVAVATSTAAAGNTRPPDPESDSGAAAAAAVLGTPLLHQLGGESSVPLSVEFSGFPVRPREGADRLRLIATYAWEDDLAEAVDVTIGTPVPGTSALVDGESGPVRAEPGGSSQIDVTIPGPLGAAPDLVAQVAGVGSVRLDPDRLTTPSAVSTAAGVGCGERSGDADGDLIPDDFERDGFAVVDGKLVPWDDDLGAEGRKRLVSDPRSCRTANDPYTDFQKAMGLTPPSGPAASRDPMVASAPVVTVAMERMMVTPTTVESEGTATTRSFSTSKSTSLTLGGKGGWEGGGEMGATGGMVSGKSSLEFSASWSRSHSITDGSSTTWQKLLTDTVDRAAELNGNVRYHNLGTAPIYEARPTTNWVIDDAAIATFRAGPNYVANALNAGDTYPAPGATALALETINEAGTQSLTITKDELAQIRAGTEVSLETPQASGNYGAYDADGHLDTAAGEWAGVVAAVRATSGTLVLDASGETAERYVAATAPGDRDGTTPVLTIGESIQRAFDVEVDGDRWTYHSHVPGDPSSLAPIRVDAEAVMLTTDEPTRARIDAYIAGHPGAREYDVPLLAGMQVGIKTADEHSEFDDSIDGYIGGEHQDAGYVRGGNRDLKLVTGHRYGVRARVSGVGEVPGTSYVRVGANVNERSVGLSSWDWLQEEGVWQDKYMEFTAPARDALVSGWHSVDQFSLFDYGPAKMADVEWTNRLDDDVPFTDSSTPTEVPVSWMDESATDEIEFTLSRDGTPVDLTPNGTQVITTGRALGPHRYEERGTPPGVVRRTLTEEGDSTLIVATMVGERYEVVAVVPIRVGPEKKATISFWGSGSTRYCTMRFPALETPAFAGETLRTVDMTRGQGGCPNDDIYDAEFTNMPVGTELSVFDSPGGNRGDDFVVWQNTRETTGRLRLDPNSTVLDGAKVIERHHENGLAGKVSRAVVAWPGAPTAGP